VYPINLKKRNLRSSLLLGASAVAAIATAGPAMAQDQPVETVVVTGSRIPQTGLYSSSPVTAIGQQELKFQGTTSVDSLINSLPSAFADYGATSSAFSGALGTASVDLRGLGASRTLVLIDGRRLMPGDPILPVADVNQIPADLIDHVEVLTGGASAVYGSDAVAGVVNFIMRKDFQGVEIDGQWSTNEHANDSSTGGNSINGLAEAIGTPGAQHNWVGGGTDDGTIILGANTDNGKGNITAWLGYRNTQAVAGSKLDYSNCALGGSGSKLACEGSSNYNRWLSFDNLVNGAPSYDYFETGTGSAGSGSFGNYGNAVAGQNTYTGAADQKYNYGNPAYVQQPSTRYTAGFDAHYDISKMAQVYTNFMFDDDAGRTLLSPSAVFLSSGPADFPGTNSPGYQQVNCSNPLLTANENKALCGLLPGDAQQTVATPNGPLTYYNGAGNLTPGQSLLYIGRRGVDVGDRTYDTEHEGYRMVLGLKGDLGGGWNYDVYAQYGRSVFQQHETKALSVSRVENALEVDPTTGECYSKEQGEDANCVPLDIFNGFGSITPAQLKYVGFQDFETGYTDERIISGSVNGDLGSFGGQSPWAKDPIGIAIGAEYRSEDLALNSGYGYQHADEYGTGAILPVPQSGFNVNEEFGELRIPVVQGLPFVEDLSLNAAYRYSTYSDVGAVHSYKYGAEWQPIDDFRLRASFARAVRAPNVLESFTPAHINLFSGTDPCASSTAGQCATVKNAGNATLLSCPAEQCNTQQGGNPNLTVESSDTRSAGIVFTPTFIDGFSATVDYFNIKVDNYVGSLGATTILSGCYGASANAESEAFYCPLVHRSGSGAIFGAGYVQDIDRNLPKLTTKGFDFEANYNADLDDYGLQGAGSLSFNFLGTMTQGLNTTPSPVPGSNGKLSSFDCAGLFGATCGTPTPRWRHKLRITWQSPWDFDLSLQWRHIGSTALDLNTNNPLLAGATTTCPNGSVLADCVTADQKIPTYDYFDLSGDWTVREGVELRAGVNNIFDKEPPVLSATVTPIPFGAANTFPGTYDPLGRNIFVGATIKY
jgi:iron complex outermembrane receptor protein